MELVYQPHTDYDDDTSDALNTVRFARLPGVGLTGLRAPNSDLRGDESDLTVELDGASRSVTRRPPVRRDLLLTVVCASNNTDELGRLANAVEKFFRVYTQVRIQLDPDDESRGYAYYDLLYGAGEVTLSDRQDGNVMVATGELRVFRIEEDALWGAPETGLDDSPSWLPHDGAVGIVWPISDPRATGRQL